MVKITVVLSSLLSSLCILQTYAMQITEKSHITLEEHLIKAALQYTILHHNTLVKKYDIKNIQSPSSPVPRFIADYILISAIVVTLTHAHLTQDLAKLNYLAPHNRGKAEIFLDKINQDFAKHIDLQGPWAIDTDGYLNVKQGKYVYANLIYTLKNFDQLLDKAATDKLFINQPLQSKILWCAHTIMVQDSTIYPSYLKLITSAMRNVQA